MWTLGCDVRVYDNHGLEMMGEEGGEEGGKGGEKVEELRGLVEWCDGMVWCAPEVHGSMVCSPVLYPPRGAKS